MPKLNQIPKRTPDIKLNAKSYSNKAFVYRLAEDNNPMHIDPKFSSILKFDRPILHGLATKGIIARVII